MTLFWNPAGRLLVGATLAIPIGTVGLLTWKSSRDRLSETVEMTPLARTALLLHAGYFAFCILSFEILIQDYPMNTTGSIPASPDNLFWQMTCLSGELFFVTMCAYALMASQYAVPRWTWLIPIAQTSYNLRNSLIWTLFYPIFSPVSKPIELMKMDAILIVGLFVFYVYTFFTANVRDYQRIN
mmetsp:Transcript_22847/g.32650  ORF Transcript_22847/g.32650 Transcript_22847/m.32650 type:complete len:184 (-) Transcript_22847:42-593(-)|eukprot:CAMPEP_0201697324 /NCGR_PEP_ID=MMETSP0578-20130828/10713_1 /ASSEMBLY_ACC=CAM_ASM_000663 /TAXON_ID=267565 /ORGANISM="Skeletonema grethea, Strain CCMP 1804" /LENGTH=183 /DNA_ID=CAMNT_0048183469 /DNA_START=51 /DNA_END=602 /DNA_ORIENTATION=+